MKHELEGMGTGPHTQLSSTVLLTNPSRQPIQTDLSWYLGLSHDIMYWRKYIDCSLKTEKAEIQREGNLLTEACVQECHDFLCPQGQAPCAPKCCYVTQRVRVYQYD